MTIDLACDTDVATRHIAKRQPRAGVERLADLTPRTIEGMYDLYGRYYEATSRQLFESDLDGQGLRGRAARRRRRGRRLLDAGDPERGDRRQRVCAPSIRATPSSSAPTGERRRSRSPGCALPAPSRRRSRTCPLYWFLIVKGHRTYRYLSAFSIDFYPHWQTPTPPWAQSIMTGFARRRFGDAYDAERGVVSFPQSRGHLKPMWAAVEPDEAARADVAFFLRSNPGYVRGDELVCLTELSCRQSAAAGPPRVRARRAAVNGWDPILAAARTQRDRVRSGLRGAARRAMQRCCGRFSRRMPRPTFGRAHGFDAIGSIDDVPRARSDPHLRGRCGRGSIA